MKLLAMATLLFGACISLTAAAQLATTQSINASTPQGSITATRHGGGVQYSENPAAVQSVGASAAKGAITATRVAGGPVRYSTETEVTQDQNTGSTTKTCTKHGSQVICN